MVAPVIFIVLVPILVAIIVLVFIHQSRTRRILQEDRGTGGPRSWAAQLYTPLLLCFRRKARAGGRGRQDFDGSSLSDVVPDIYLPPVIFPSQDLDLFARSFHSDTNDSRYHTGVSLSSRA